MREIEKWHARPHYDIWLIGEDKEGGELIAETAGCPEHLGAARKAREAYCARLIAAAPDLLAALELVIAHSNPQCAMARHIDYVTRTAVAKATGEPSMIVKTGETE